MAASRVRLGETGTTSGTGKAQKATDRVTFRQVLARRDFARVWVSQAISKVGDRLTQVAIGVYILQLADGSATAVGLSMMVQSIPVVVLGPLAGVFIDRWDKRKVMVVCDLLRAAIIACAPFTGSRLGLYLVAFLMSAVTTVFTPALQASLPDLLEDRREILVANSVMQSTRSFTDLIGFLFAGVLVGLIGARAGFWADAATFVISASLLLRISRPLAAGRERKPGAAAGVWSDLRAGVRYHRENPVVLSLLISFCLGVLVMGGLNALLLVAIPKLLGLGASVWGFLLATQGAVMFVSAAAIGRWAQKVPKPYLILAGILGVGLCSFGFSQTHTLLGALVLYAVLGACNAVFLLPSVSWIQEITPAEYRGRVFSLRNVALELSAIVSYGLFGALGDALGVSFALVIVGLALCCTTVLSAFLPGFREAFTGSRRPPAQEAGA